MFCIKRVYDLPSKDDGYRILVDRLWPRAMSKNDAKIDTWLKDIAPSHGLRRWFNHSPQKWNEFRLRYFYELSKKNKVVQEIRAKEASHDTVTLLYGAKSPQYNNAMALKEYLEKRV